jgi:hypothetical protein
MTGTFGGVDSRWYVSPALFPFVTLFVITVCTLMLFRRALKENGFEQFFALRTWVGDWTKTINKDRWYVILVLCLYIYVFVPSIDFFLATAMFLYALTFRFYVENEKLSKWIFNANLLGVGIVFLVRLFDSDSFYLLSQDSTLNEPQILHTDIGIILLLVVSTFKFLQVTQGDSKTRWHVLLTALFVPLFLMFSFNFLLQVPMPVEYGTVIKGMEFLWYDVFNL